MDEQHQPQQPVTPQSEFQPSPLQGEPLLPQPNKNLWIYLLIVLVVAGGAFWFYVWQKGGFLPALPTPIVTFEQCVAAGNPIMESFPERCRTQDGALFVNWQGAGQFCVQVITPARNPQTGEVRDFTTPCDVPENWEPVIR